MFGLIFDLVCLFLEVAAVAALAGVGYFAVVFTIGYFRGPAAFAEAREKLAVLWERIDYAFDRLAFAFALFVCAVVGVFQVLTYYRL